MNSHRPLVLQRAEPQSSDRGWWGWLLIIAILVCLAILAIHFLPKPTEPNQLKEEQIGAVLR